MISNCKKALFIVNASSGVRNAGIASRYVRARLNNWKINTIQIYPGIPLDQQVNLLRRQGDWDLIFVFGGDGTIFHSLPILEPLDIPIIPIPLGSANDLATELGLIDEIDEIISKAVKGNIELIDILSVNGRLFATVAGVGLGAEVVSQFNRERNDRGFMNWKDRLCAKNIYKALSVKNAFHTKSISKKYSIETADESIQIESTAIFVSNTNKLGADLKMSHNSKLNDGYFEILIVPAAGAISTLNGLVSLSQGKIPDSYIQLKADKCRIIPLMVLLHFILQMVK